jgi:pilus assembly protein Flp/PilA
MIHLNEARGPTSVITLRRLLKTTSGSTAIEYGLIAALVSVALISGLGAFYGNLNNTFSMLGSAMTAW